MTYFSVISSTILLTGIAKFVGEKYLLTANSSCSLLKTGINHIYRIDTENKTFIFSVYNGIVAWFLNSL